jgi:hypothetical protein
VSSRHLAVSFVIAVLGALGLVLASVSSAQETTTEPVPTEGESGTTEVPPTTSTETPSPPPPVAPAPPPADMPLEVFRSRRIAKRQNAKAIFERKCIAGRPHQFGTAHRDILPWRRRANLGHWSRVVDRAQAAKGRCIPTSPEGVIRYVWPGYLEGTAILVSRCETVKWTDFYNESSGAAGLFQLMPMHYAGKFDPFYHLANARYALGLYQERGWWPWLASNGCHRLL